MKDLKYWLLDNDYEFSSSRNINNQRQITVYGKYTKKSNSHDYTMNLDHLKLLMYLDNNYFERFNVNIDMDNQRIIITELEINDDSLFTDEELKA